MHETRELSIEDLRTSYVASVQTDAGCVRESNEDSGRYFHPHDAESRERNGVLTVVADGMGGHASGEVASRMAVEIISREYYADVDPSRSGALRSAIEAANDMIFTASTNDEAYEGMGTTVVALVLMGDSGFSAHVGDSRLYRMRGRRLEMMTTDHSEVMEMVRLGRISMEEARTHEDKNVILKAVGTQSTVEVDVSEPFNVAFGDVFLLCSDGLTDMMEDGEIEAILDSQPDPHHACEALIAEAKRLGGHDNITVGVVKVSTEEHVKPRSGTPITRDIEAAAG